MIQLFSSIVKKVEAQAAVPTQVIDPLNSTFGNGTQLVDIFGLVMNVIIGVGIALTVIFAGIGGIQYIMAKDDTKKADGARVALTNAVIGFLVVVGAVTVRYVASNLVGVDDQDALTNLTF